MEWSYIRLIAHALLIIDAITAGYMVYLARGRQVRIVFWWVAVIGLVFVGLWLVGLAFSMRGIGPLPRAWTVPLLASLEILAGGVLGAWLAIVYKTAFQLRVGARDKMAALLIAFALVRSS